MSNKLAHLKLTIGDQTLEDRRRFINASDAEVADWCRCQFNRFIDALVGLNPPPPKPVVKRGRKKKCDK